MITNRPVRMHKRDRRRRSVCQLLGCVDASSVPTFRFGSEEDPLPPAVWAVYTAVRLTREKRSGYGADQVQPDASLAGSVSQGPGARAGPTLRVRFFGSFEIEQMGAPIRDYQSRLAQTLLRRLLAERGGFVSVESLIAALWPSKSPANPLNSLRVRVYEARQAIGMSELIRSVDGGYVFMQDERCTVDLDDFVSLVREGFAQVEQGFLQPGLATLGDAADLWRGEPLAEDACAPWAQPRRQDLALLRQEAARGAAQVAATIGHSMSLGLAARAAAIDPLSESANLLLVRALAQSGDPGRAIEEFENFRRRVADQLGMDLSAEAHAIQLALLQGRALPPADETSGVSREAKRQLSSFAIATFLG